MRPELTGPPEFFYNDTESAKYNNCARMIRVQNELAKRAIELLNLEEGRECFILDIGCGSGLSGVALEEAGHAWVGIDVSKSMLDIAADRDSSGDVFLQDMGFGLPFRPGVFDGAISISALQWLCYSNDQNQTARSRLNRFFSSLYSSLKRGSRAVLQFYPENEDQLELISAESMKAGFSGGLVIDYPNSAKAKKYYLCLFAGQDPSKDGKNKKQTLPKALGVDGGAEAGFEKRRETTARKRKSKKFIKTKDWVQDKKEQRRRKGLEVKRDSKYTARRRAAGF